MFKLDVREWDGATTIAAVDLDCGYCGKTVSSNTGYTHKLDKDKAIVLCPGCGGPTFFVSLHTGRRSPESMPGRTVKGPPKDIVSSYNEARRALAASCYTAATLLCRSIVVHVAVDKKMKDPTTIASCVEHLIEEGHIAQKDEERVAKLRAFAAEAAHQVKTVSRTEAVKVLAYAEHLLLEVYE